jgi:hypothetical protein
MPTGISAASKYFGIGFGRASIERPDLAAEILAKHGSYRGLQTGAAVPNGRCRDAR